MKRILVTGAKGFIGRHIKEIVNPEDELVEIGRKDLNLCDSAAVTDYFKSQYFDWVIHCAIEGGRHNYEIIDPATVYVNNTMMFNNLSAQRERFGKFISFGSGAEFDRTFDINESSDLFKARPVDNYGLSKNQIARRIELLQNFYNIRLFGVFSPDELPDRFIKANMLRHIKHEPMIVHQNRWMDFIAMSDLLCIIKNYLYNDDVLLLPKHLNAVYKEKYSLMDICKFINSMGSTAGSRVEIQVQKAGLSTSYYGVFNEKFIRFCETDPYAFSYVWAMSDMYTKLKQEVV